MTAGVHHVTVVTRNACRLATLLVETLHLPVLGTVSVPFAEAAELFGWTAGPDPLVSTLFGSGATGLVEVVDYPEAASQSSQGLPPVGVYQLSFGVRDLDGVLAACAGRVDETAGPVQLCMQGSSVRVATVRVGGVRIQLTEVTTAPTEEESS